MAKYAMTREEAHKESLKAMIRALARCVNQAAIIHTVEQPERGTFRGDAPLDQQTRTITFVVHAKTYDSAFDLPGK